MRQLLRIFALPIFIYSAIAVIIALIFLSFENKILPEETSVPPQIDYEAVPNSAIAGPPPKIYSDIEAQKPLPNPPAIVKGVYLTSWSAGTNKRADYVIELAKATEINAVIIDIKDFSGLVAYASDLPEVKKYSAREVRIPKLNSLIKKLHDAGIYVIARQTVFQDPILARARPDLAVHSRTLLGSSTPTAATLWPDRKGLAWVDPAAKEAWDYNIAIAKEAAARGFDEINFDYIRFPADGDIDDTKFLVWDEIYPARSVIKDFFKHLRGEMPGIKISADLFGLATIEKSDLGIGQIIEHAYEYFDFVSPMVYPSHYSLGFQGFKEPAAHPYEIVKYSLDEALKRLITYNLQLMIATSSSVVSRESLVKAKLRPWLQDFTLRGIVYDAEKIKAEIKAVQDSLGEHFNGFMLWSPTNVYTSEALERE